MNGREEKAERKERRGEDQGAEERRLDSWPSIPYFHKSKDLHLVLPHIKVLLSQ